MLWWRVRRKMSSSVVFSVLFGRRTLLYFMGNFFVFIYSDFGFGFGFAPLEIRSQRRRCCCSRIVFAVIFVGVELESGGVLEIMGVSEWNYFTVYSSGGITTGIVESLKNAQTC
ncbi:hypothetical protein L6452_06400 [Arctium lappa]|uniref:Uncharacterized protein n=1 Tax=Arctium lappa TaxID=4217 RepID=A0ACB9EIF3_ARCLA|nr:hypothetical protein L6452_06400 [Arctium lappa]